MSKARRFLFLQGFNSRFLARLGERLSRAGHQVGRINFCVGDALYWGRAGDAVWHFRGSADAWPEYLSTRIADGGYTDLVLMGDARPLHEAAIPLARWYGMRVHVFEEGYFRPNWITLEEGGVNGYSSLPRDPDWYREAGRLVPHYGDGEPMGTPFRSLLLNGLGYRLPGALNPLLFPGYQTHRPHNGAIEAFGWTRRYLRKPIRQRQDEACIQELRQSGEPYYLLPLQLGSDSQIQRHSDFRGIPFLLKRVLRSFARNAPADARLVIKNHPLDTGLVDYASLIRRMEAYLGLEGRIVYLEGGHMPTLLEQARGVVLVNSTVGPSALLHGCPVITLGEAIYDLPGLTFQGRLDEFWDQGQPPDRALFRDFRNTVIHTTQINGGFYTREGIERATGTAALRLQQTSGPLDELLIRLGQPAGHRSPGRAPVVAPGPTVQEAPANRL